LLQSSLSERLRGAEPIAAGGGEQEDAAELPVLLPARVLEEAADLARTEEGIETGGLLIGHLHHDQGMAELLVEVTAQLPARHTCGDATKLTFTAQTWTEARATLALRGKDEIMLGWWHSHPVRHWCRNCPLDRQRDCALARGFLSADDRALHRAIFPSAYSVALLASDVAFDDVSFSLFGWRQGRIERRGFHRRQEAASVAPAASSTTAEREAGEANEEDARRQPLEAPAPLAATPSQIPTPAGAGGYAERPR
jgi:proteasome lid subunit RPN8/RPN11